MRAMMVVGAVFMLSLAVADEQTADRRAADQQKLAPLQDYVGQWRGVGQPRRGSSKGAWIAEGQWRWQFADDGAALLFEMGKGKYFQSARIAPGENEGEFQWLGYVAKDQPPAVYNGKLDDGKLVLVADSPQAKLPARISLRMVARGKRLLILYEKPLGDTGRYTRLAEVGYTRKGSGFGQGTHFPECVVTGGYAKMTVTYQGESYPVCCKGCKDLFEMDPAGILAEYRQRKATEKAEKERR